MLLLARDLHFGSVGGCISVHLALEVNATAGVVLDSDHALILLTIPQYSIAGNVSTALWALKYDMRSEQHQVELQPAARKKRGLRNKHAKLCGLSVLERILRFKSLFQWMTGPRHSMRTCS